MSIYPNNLSTYRRFKNLSQRDLAFLLGFPNVTSISEYERGVILPNLEHALALCIALQTPLDALFKEQAVVLEEEIFKRKQTIRLNSS